MHTKIPLLRKFIILKMLFGSLLVLASCSTGRRVVNINTKRPADITIPSSVKSILLVDRTKFNKNVLNVAESILTGELPGEDNAATQALIQAFRAKLGNNARFTTKVAAERLEGNSVSTAFPKQIPWATIRRLCARYQTDAVLAVEIFDSDFIITQGKRKTKKKIKEGNITREVEVDEFYARGVDNLQAGLKFYIPATQNVIDQKLYKKIGTWEAGAASKAGALAGLIQKSMATRQLAEGLGRAYAFRVAPMPVRLQRYFRGKAKRAPELEQGSRYADVANWKEAINVWKSGLDRAPTREAGYLAYNIAVAYEVLGNFKLSKEWAQTSYVRYGNRDGKPNYDLLNRRIANEQRAKSQLGE